MKAMKHGEFWTSLKDNKLIIFVSMMFFCVILASGCSPTQEPLSNPKQFAIDAEPAAIHKLGEQSKPTATDSNNGINHILGLTHQHLDGNRLIDGTGGFLNEPLDIQLAGKPLWVVAVPFQELNVWYVALENGQIQAFQVDGITVLELKPAISFLPPGMPPVLVADEDHVYLSPIPPDASAVSSPILLQDGTQVYIDHNGLIRLNHSGEEYSIPSSAIPDARILSDEAGRLLFLSGPTNSYPHGILGDDIEATTITVVNKIINPFEIEEIKIDEGDVIESMAPIWVDIDGDGHREIIVTQSNSRDGSKIVVYREDGTVFAKGDSIGKGFRWIHQIVAAQFIEEGPLEIAAIHTPHIGGVVELYTLQGNRLEIVASLSGYSSHQIGTRNLDSALASDINGDGLIELIVPDQQQMNLAGIQFDGSNLSPVWNLPLDARLSSNLAIVKSSDGRLMLGAGTEDQILRIWISKE